MSGKQRSLTTIAAVLTLALVLFAGVPVNAYAVEQVSDTQTEETQAVPKAKKANPLKVAAKKTIEAKATKTTTVKNAITIRAAQGKVTFKTSNKKVMVVAKKNMKDGKAYKLNIVVKEGLKKNKTYKVEVRVKAAGNAKYKPATVKKTIRVKVT